MTTKVTPNSNGTDVESDDHIYDGHVRVERSGKTRALVIDVFRSSLRDPEAAHVESESFPLSQDGTVAATGFLEGYGFRVTIANPRR